MAQEMTIITNLQTRESRMLAGGRVQFAVTDKDTGYTVYLKFEAKIKNPEGSDKRYSAASLFEATHVFLSEKGYGTPRLGTYYPPREGYDTGRLFSDMVSGSPHMEALEAIIGFVADADESTELAHYTITAEDQCGMCGHKLEDPESIARGIGPECAGKPTGTKILHPAITPEQKERALDRAVADVQRSVDAAMDDHGKQIKAIRKEKIEAALKIDQLNKRIQQLEAQEAELMDEVPF